MVARELLQQVWTRHKGMLLAILLLLVANVVVFVSIEQFLVPEVSAKERLYIQRQAEVRQLTRHQDGTARSPEYSFIQAKKDLNDFRQMIPPYDEFTGLIEELLVLSERTKLEITSVSYRRKETASPDFLEYSLSFNVSGSYAQVKQFIHSLEVSERILSIREIGLQGKEHDGRSGVSLRLKLQTFFRSEASEHGS